MVAVHSAKNKVKTATKQTYLWTARSWLTLYRLLFAAIVLGNLIVVILASAGACNWASLHRVQFAVANTLITVLTRNEVRQEHLFLALYDRVVRPLTT